MSSDAIHVVQLQRTMSNIQVISMSLLVYDWILVFSDEIAHIWASPWTLVKILYLWTRYSPVADTVLRILGNFAFPTTQQCQLYDTLSSWLVAMGIYTSELILVWRTFAIWSDSKRVKYSLGVVWVLLFPMGLYSLVIFVRSTKFAPQPYPNQPGCNLVDASASIVSDFIGLAVLEIVIVVLTVIKGVATVRTTPQLAGVPYIWTLYRDGVLFFMCLTVLSVGNAVALSTGPKSNARLLPTFIRKIHSTLCCRVILNLRTTGTTERDDDRFEDVCPPSVFRSRLRALSTLRFNGNGGGGRAGEYVRMEDEEVRVEGVGLEGEAEVGRCTESGIGSGGGSRSDGRDEQGSCEDTLPGINERRSGGARAFQEVLVLTRRRGLSVVHMHAA